MKRAIAILFVTVMFGAASLLAAQETPGAAANVAPAVATPTVAANSAVTTELGTASGVQPLMTAPEADKSPAKGRADSEKPVLDREGNPDPAQNVIEYGGAG